jgi:outer membrane protein TolC
MPCVANRLALFTLPVVLALAPRVAKADVVKLEALEALALQNRGSVAGAQARVAGAEARIALAKVPYYPTLEAKASALVAPGGRVIQVQDYNETKGTPAGRVSNASPYSVFASRALGDRGAFNPNFHYEAILTFQSRIYDFGRTSSAVSAARADREAAMAGVRSERESLALEVRGAYLGWLSAYGTRAILAQTANDAAALRARTEANIAEGSRAGAELSAARFEEARAALDLERSESDLDSARLDIEQATGAPLAKNAEPDETLLERQPPPAPVSKRADIALLERRRDAAAAAATAHGHPFAPVLGVGLDAGLKGQGYTPFPLYDVGLTLSVPLLDGGLEAANAAQATSQANDFAAQAREAKRRLSIQEQRSRAALERASRRLELAQALVAAADEQVLHAVHQHELGGDSADAVELSRMQAERARLEVLTARVEHARAVLELGSPSTP